MHRSSVVTRAIGGGFTANVRAGVGSPDLRVHNARLRRVLHVASHGSIRGLRPQRTGIQGQTESQQQKGNFVHKVDLERSGSP